MPLIGVHTDVEHLQKRWIFGALGIALVFHAVLAWALGWYKIPGLEVPFNHSAQTGPFTIKQIEINPDAFKSDQQNPVSNLPVVQPPQNPAEFNLDPNLVEKALQTPQPSLATPSVPEPDKVIAATDLSHGLPYVESDSASISADIAKVEPTAGGGPLTSAKLAEQLLSSSPGPTQTGPLSGAPPTGNGNTGKLPGFAQLAPNFKAAAQTVTNLPEPVLLRLPSDVLFDFDSAQLKPDAPALLGQAVDMISKYPQADIHIDGYSDSFGQADYNVALSQKRSEAVQAWFQQHTAQATYNFHSQGHGSTDFIVSAQGTIDQQQPNRRVEILIQATKP
jgi:outer membrane protein OmpA-like peptidoglycan-associated protein